MKKHITTIIILCLITIQVRAQFPYGDRWYQNPLGFKPVEMHAAMGFILPAVAVGTSLLLTQRDTTLAKRLSVYNESGFSWGYKYPYTFMPQNNSGINYQLRTWLSIGTELGIYFPSDNFNNTIGVAIRPFARFYPIHNKIWQLYFESGGGFIYLFDEFSKPTDKDPRLGTQFNGVTKYGIGSTVNLSPSASLMFGIRHLHISNGNKLGVDRNPSHDSNGFFIGFEHHIK